MMTMTPITLIIIALFVFWRGFARGAFYRTRDLLVAHGVPVEPLWLEWIGEKIFNGIAWIAERFKAIIGIIVIVGILSVVVGVTYDAIF